MIVGLDAWTPEDTDWFRDLGVTWTKLAMSGCTAGGVHALDLDNVAAATEAGMTVVIDVRPVDEMQQRLAGLQMNADDETTDKLLAELHAMGAAVAADLAPYSSRYEWWGEYECPYVSGFWPNKRAAYPTLLQAVAEGIRSIQPEAEIWNGGYGVNFQPQFLEALIGADIANFDRANWHQYNISEYWPRDRQGQFEFGTPLHKRVAYSANKFREMFTGARAMMDAAGATQPFVSSEWGMPVVSDEVVDALGRIGLHSFVFQDGVFGLGDAQAAQFFNAWMAVFEQAGFEVLIYHRLKDAPPGGADADGTFWGTYCGLLYEDGTEKAAMMAAFRDWVERGQS